MFGHSADRDQRRRHGYAQILKEAYESRKTTGRLPTGENSAARKTGRTRSQKNYHLINPAPALRTARKTARAAFQSRCQIRSREDSFRKDARTLSVAFFL